MSAMTLVRLVWHAPEALRRAWLPARSPRLSQTQGVPPQVARDPQRLRRHHLVILTLSIAVVVLSSSLTTVNDNRQIAVPGFTQFPLPEVCQSRVWLKTDCPGCGLTRSFIHFFHGRFRESLALHRFGWLLALVVAAQIPYRLAALMSPRGLPLGTVFPQAVGIGLIVLFTGNWLVKLAGW